MPNPLPRSASTRVLEHTKLKFLIRHLAQPRTILTKSGEGNHIIDPPVKVQNSRNLVVRAHALVFTASGQSWWTSINWAKLMISSKEASIPSSKHVSDGFHFSISRFNMNLATTTGLQF